MDSSKTQPHASRPRAVLGAVAMVACALAVYAWQVLLYVRHVNDDAFITFRYSRFLASGLGPYFNPGEHVEGYTNFLLMVAMAPVYALGGEAAVPLAAKTIGIVAGAIALLIGARVAHGVAVDSGFDATAASLTAGLAACLAAIAPGFALNSTSGLETALYGCLVTLAVYLGLRAETDGRWRWSGIAWALAILTRPEAVVIFGVWWLARAVATRSVKDTRAGHLRMQMKDALWVAGVVAAHLVFRLVAYDGEWLPNTFYAKSGGFVGTDPLDYVLAGGMRPFLGVVGFLAGLLGWLLTRSVWRRGIPVAVAGVAGLLLPFAVGTDWMPGWRFSVPYLPLLACVVATGWMRWLRPATSRFVLLGPAAAVLLLVGAFWLQQGERRELAREIDLRARGYASGHAALADWIDAEGTRPGDTVALMDIGIVGYRCPERRVLDITGLTNRYIGKRVTGAGYDPAYVLEQAPELIVIVLTAPAEVGQPLPPGAPLGTWTGLERRILEHPAFAKHYVRGAAPRRPTTDWIGRLASRVGAERIFEHAHPGRHYLLAVFRRKVAP